MVISLISLFLFRNSEFESDMDKMNYMSEDLKLAEKNLLIKPWDETVLQNLILVFDALGYHNLGTSLLHHGIFPSALRTPGYPFFISLLYYIFGIKPWVVIICQIFIDSCTIILIYSLANSILDEKTATVAAGLYALDPIAIYYSNMLLTESFFTFLFFLSILL